MMPTESLGLRVPEPEPERDQPGDGQAVEELADVQKQRDDLREELKLTHAQMREAEEARDEYREELMSLKSAEQKEEDATVAALRALVAALPTRAAGTMKYFAGEPLVKAYAIAADRLRVIDERAKK